MVSLEQQFERALDSILLDDSGSRLTDSGIVHSCLVNDDFAKITLILPEDSPLRKDLPDKVENVVRELETINRVAVEVLKEPPDEEKTPPKESTSQRTIQQPKRTAYLQN